MALISFEEDTWVTEHDACEQLCRNIYTQLVAWKAENRSSAAYGQLSADIRFKLKQFRSEIGQLSELLRRTKREIVITDAEHERRFRQIETLQSKCKQLQTQFDASVHSMDSYQTKNADLNKAKEELFRNPNSRPGASRYGEVSTANWGTESDDDDFGSANNNQPSLEQIKKNQTDLLNEQDKGLEALSKIISRQINLAENLGNEVTMQNDIIDDLADHMDRTNDQMQDETGQIRVLHVKDSTCWYWTVIILLFIVIIVLICI